MNPQTTPPDITLDRILSALRETPAPTGMNQRITARIAQAQTEPQRSSLAARSWQLLAGRPNPASLAARSRQLAARRLAPFSLAARSRQLAARRLAPTHRYALTATALLLLTLFTLHHRISHSTQPTIAIRSNPPSTQSNPSTSASTRNTASQLQAGGQPDTSVWRSPTYPSTTTRGPEARSVAPTDPDALALAETLAPSRPIAPMPLTAEEHLMMLATRQGQPMELAELETLRQPALQARSEAHQQATIRDYIHTLLAPLAAAEAIHPTPPIDDAQAPPSPSK
jgi:hypothetical protein